MSEKAFRIPLFGDAYVEVYVRRAHGRVENFGVILIKHNDCVTRHDCSHDMPHRDVLGKKAGLIRKEFYDMSRTEAFEYALADLKSNAERYIAYYEAH